MQSHKNKKAEKPKLSLLFTWIFIYSLSSIKIDIKTQRLAARSVAPLIFGMPNY